MESLMVAAGFLVPLFGGALARVDNMIFKARTLINEKHSHTF